MSDRRKPHEIVLRLAAVLLILTVASTAMVVGRYARYISYAGGEDSARVAKFEVTVSDAVTQYASVQVQPGENAEKYFTVENKSEVAVALHFQVRCKYDNLPLVFDNPSSDVVAPGETKDVPLMITWPAGENDAQYMGMVDLIEISVRAEQVD